MPPSEIARCMNTIAAFVGMRDAPELSRGALEAAGLPKGQADVAVLTGGAILAGADVFAEAIRAGVARTYVLVGGVGHTTETFRARVRELWPAAEFGDSASEAEVWDAYLRSRHGLAANVLECRSTNSGANISCLFTLLRELGIEPKSMLLVQDATMQRRLDACLRKQEPQVRAVNYAAYQVRVVKRTSANADSGSSLAQLAYDHDELGMWSMDRYLTLLMGEIPRLMDAPGGYGPRGANLIAHVDIPNEVLAAFEALREQFPSHVRTANSAFASLDNTRRAGD